MKTLTLTVAAAGIFPALMIAAPNPADAAIHEIVAAYCSGGGVGVITEEGMLEPPGLTDMDMPSFAKPVMASGAVDFPLTTDKPNTKYPEGSNVFAIADGIVASDHPSAQNCPRSPLPD